MSLGFDLCGIASVQPLQRADYYRHWIDTNQHGTMRYLAGRLDERFDPRVYFPPAQSVICVAMNYHVADNTMSVDEESKTQGRIAKYARAEDYHIHIKNRLHAFSDWLRTTFPGCENKVAVDTAPVMERELAARAGIGWQGKNTCVISPKIGSWIFLAEIFTSLPLPPDEPDTDHCGTCSKCIDACPTDAITAPYQLDARKCISYLTIEHREPIDPSLQKQTGDWLFGCDICQDVCPFNGRAPIATDRHLQPRMPETLDAHRVANWSLDEYHIATRHTALRRVKLPMFQRNARIVLENHQ